MSINHKIVFIDKTENANETFFCKLCSYVLIKKEDFSSNKEYGCCHECYLNFCESRKKEWKNGWRPDKTKLKEYIYNRKNIIKNS